MSEGETPKGKACDPGWNDPPLFSYDVHQAQLQSTRRTHLTKRVVFPFEKKGESPSKLEQTQLVPNTPVPCNLPKTNEEPSSQSREDHDEEISLLSVLDNFHFAIGEVYKENMKQASEVERRFSIMEVMWNEDKFNSNIKQKIFKLSQAIRDGDLDKADSFQRGLMVDYSSVCSSWMSGVRNLLNKKRSLVTQT